MAKILGVETPTWSSVKQFIFGFIVGYIVDAIAEYIYWNIVPVDYRFSMWTIAGDDLFVFAIGIALLIKKPAFGVGYIVGAAVGSATPLQLSRYYRKQGG
jgi:hypothetical protein